MNPVAESILERLSLMSHEIWADLEEMPEDGVDGGLTKAENREVFDALTGTLAAFSEAKKAEERLFVCWDRMVAVYSKYGFGDLPGLR